MKILKYISFLAIILTLNLSASEVLCSPTHAKFFPDSRGHLILKIHDNGSVTGKHVNLKNNKVSLLKYKSSQCRINEDVSIDCRIKARNNHGTSLMSSIDVSLTNSVGNIHSYVPFIVHGFNCIQLKR